MSLPNAESHKILLVHEDYAEIERIQKVFPSPYYLRIEAYGEMVKGLALQDRYAAIIVNIHLSGAVNGIEVALQLSQDKRTAHIPVIVCLEQYNQDMIRLTTLAGARDYWIKSEESYIALAKKVENIIAQSLVQGVGDN